MGGEPTVAGEKYLNEIAENAHNRNFLMWMTTNGIKTKTVEDILPNFDYVQITCDTPEQAAKWAKSKHLDRINIKFPCTDKTTLNDFHRFVDATKDFPNKSNGNVDGVTVKRIIEGRNIFGEYSMVPKLYPNGNYNNTWAHELSEPYLGKL